MSAYAANLWKVRSLPFLSQALFSNRSNGTTYLLFNQSSLLGVDLQTNQEMINNLGVPYLATSNALSLLTNNLSVGAIFTHILLWNFNHIKSVWSSLSENALRYSSVKGLWRWARKPQCPLDTDRDPVDNDTDLDPHYKLLLAYKDTPNVCYAIIFGLSLAGGLASIYLCDSTLPWWGLVVAIALSALFCLFFIPQWAVTGFVPQLAPLAHLVGGYLLPGRPLANLFFVVFCYNVFR